MSKHDDDFQPKKRPVDEPAGHKREEAKKASADELAERAEKEMPDGGAVNLKNLTIVNEVAQQVNSLEVTNPQPGFTYKWLRFKAESGISQVQLALGEKIKVREDNGNEYVMCPWEVVQGSMPEAMERKGKGEDTTRCIVDVMLMRCRTDIYQYLQERAHQRHMDRWRGTMQGVEEFGAKHGIKVHTDPNDPVLQRAMAHAAANELSNRKQDQLIREGRMPGVPAPGQ